MQESSEGKYRFDQFEIDQSRRTLSLRGEELKLNQKTFDLLLELVKSNNIVVSKDDLLDRVWPDQFVEENNLTVQISALRKVLGDGVNEKACIVTVPGRGYKFVADVFPGAATPAAHVTIENRTVERITIEEFPEVSRQTGMKKGRATLAAGVVVVLLAAACAWMFWDRSGTAPPRIDSIAVMPFVYEGGNADAEYLSDGMTESLINSLSRLPNLTVKARNSVFKYKGQAVDSRSVAAEMSVQALLLGRILERGDRITLSLELIDARLSNHLWGATYERRTADLAGLQNEIARDVSDKLRQKLTGNGALAKGQTTSSEAMTLYQKGRFFWNKRRHNDHLKAIELFEQAIALDPKFALAYAGLADVYTVESFKYDNKTERDEKGRGYAQKALEIEPELAEAYTVLAKIAWNRRDGVICEQNFRKAIELNPNYASARQWHGEFLAQHGRHDAARAELDQAMELDPLSLVIMSDSAHTYIYARNYDAAIAEARRALEFDRTWSMAWNALAAAYEARGDYEATLDTFAEKSRSGRQSEVDKKRVMEEIDYTRTLLRSEGPTGYWKANLEIARRYPPDEHDHLLFALCLAQMGDNQAAMDELEKAVVKDQAGYGTMMVEPLLEPLKNEPRFQALLARIGLLTEF